MGEKASRPDGPGWVYFLADSDYRYMKIGFSRNVERRLAAIQDGGPLALHLVDEFPGDTTDEQSVHAILKADRLRGEWFRADPVLDFLEDAEEARRRIVERRYFKPAIHKNKTAVVALLDKVTMREILFERRGML